MDNLVVYLLISAALFMLGLLAIMTRKNAVSVLMGVELVLNSAGLNFVAFSRFSVGGAGNIDGQVAALFVIIVAAAEAAVALAIFLNLYRIKATTSLDKADLLHG